MKNQTHPTDAAHAKGKHSASNLRDLPHSVSSSLPHLPLVPQPDATDIPHEPLRLDTRALEAARTNLDEGAITPHSGPWREDIIALLNDSLATELVCVLRYKRHHFTAQGLASPRIAEEFLAHALEETEHADRLARRIVQLGGEPDFSPDSLSQRSHAPYDDSKDLQAMLRSNLSAERVAIEAYSQCISLVGDKDHTTRRLLEDLLADEQAHAEELRDWLAH